MISLSFLLLSVICQSAFAGHIPRATHGPPQNMPAAVISGAITALKYTNVGGSGSYEQVTKMVPGEWPSCKVQQPCQKQKKSVSGKLAPFSDDQTIVFAGPMHLHKIAVFQPKSESSSTWSRVSHWKAGSEAENLVFMNNNGGSKSGEWSICHGASQSYANGDWTDATTSANKEITHGILQPGKQVNIMTSSHCTSSKCEGFYRGAAHLGWAGSKMFVIEFTMPSMNSDITSAIWALSGQIVRAAQYGCNCRGMGGSGGCGELDIVENLQSGNHNHGVSEIYSFKGATGTGSGSWFPRPLTEKVIYSVIFDVKTDSIAIQRWTDFNWERVSMSRTMVDRYLNADSKVVSFH